MFVYEDTQLENIFEDAIDYWKPKVKKVWKNVKEAISGDKKVRVKVTSPKDEEYKRKIKEVYHKLLRIGTKKAKFYAQKIRENYMELTDEDLHGLEVGPLVLVGGLLLSGLVAGGSAYLGYKYAKATTLKELSEKALGLYKEILNELPPEKRQKYEGQLLKTFSAPSTSKGDFLSNLPNLIGLTIMAVLFSQILSLIRRK